MPTLLATAEPSTDINYVDRGSGQPVVLIHGWPLSHRMWEGQINALVDAGYRCVAYDRRGFGDSGKPNGGYDYDTFASDLNDLMTTLDLENAVLAGFSMGGGEVARYIGRYGTKRVAKTMLLGAVTPGLMKTATNPDGAPGEVFDGMVATIKADRVGFFEGFFKGFFGWVPGSGTPSDDVVAYHKAIAWFASPQATQECVIAFGKTDFRDDLAKFDVPTMIVHGDADGIVPIAISAARTQGLIAGSRYEIIPGAAHGFAATHGARLNELMLDFLAS